jgi:hypothetical protein
MTVTTTDCGCRVTQPHCVKGQLLFIRVNNFYHSGLVINGTKPEASTDQNWVVASRLYSEHCKENRNGQGF